MTEHIPRWLILGFAVLVVAGGLGGATTYALFSDTERASLQLRAAADFTVDTGHLFVQPASATPDSNQDVLYVYLNVSAPSAVDESRFTLRLADRTERVPAVGARCVALSTAEMPTSAPWTCRVAFDRAAIRRLVNHNEGTYDIIVHGWWVYDRDFVATGTVTLPDDENATATATPMQTPG